MLPAFIIDEIRRREQRERAPVTIQPTLEMPRAYPPEPSQDEDEGEKDRGVVIIEVL